MPPKKTGQKPRRLTRVWTSLDKKTLGTIYTRMIAENRTMSAMIRKLVLDQLSDQK